MITKRDLNRAWEMQQDFNRLYNKGIISIQDEDGIHLNTDAFLETLKVVGRRENNIKEVPRDCDSYPCELWLHIDDEITVFTLLNVEEFEVYEQFGIHGLAEWYFGEEE